MNDEKPLSDGPSLRGGSVVTVRGRTWTVLRVSAVEPAILCKEGHPPRWGGRTTWFYTDEVKEIVT